MKTYLIDIDGTICTEEKTFERYKAVPDLIAKEVINDLYVRGNTIIFYTARGWEQYEMTLDWLKNNGFYFDTLLMGKPIADVIIDDRACKIDWNEIKEREFGNTR